MISNQGGSLYGERFEDYCGCVRGEVLAVNGFHCELCSVESHFICNGSAFPSCVLLRHHCDGLRQCEDGTDEVDCPFPCRGGACVSQSVASDVLVPIHNNKAAYIVGVALCVFVLLCLAALLVYYRQRPPLEDALMLASASPAGLKSQQSVARVAPLSKTGCSMYTGPQQRPLLESGYGSCSAGCLNATCAHSNGSAHLGEMFSMTPTTIGGLHPSSSSSSTTHYPKETANPPPTPTTRLPSICYHPSHPNFNNGRLQYMGYIGPHSPMSSPTSPQFMPLATNHSYRHYKTRNRPPPPTPCSTDICDDSDVNSTTLVTSSDNDPEQHLERSTRYHPNPPQNLPHHPNSPTAGHPPTLLPYIPQRPNSPITQYYSFSSLPRTDYYGDSDPEPPPPTPQLLTDRSVSPPFVNPPVRGCTNGRRGDTIHEEADDDGEVGLLLGNTTSAAPYRHYCPPPPSPAPSD